MLPSSFVKINTIFTKNEERTVPWLASYYDDIPSLTASIKEIIQDKLSVQNVKGKRVLIKPNWVLHSRCEADIISLRTHESFVLATLDIILSMSPSCVVVGDAPIQGCDWEKMLSQKFIAQIESLGKKYGIPVHIKDFRRVTFKPGKNVLTVERNPIDNYVILNTGNQSFLEPISSTDTNLFRVTDYNPDRLAESHQPGLHKYCITKELFDADVVLSLPKVKTHQKTGITAALKNMVGINGDKDFLPHHRIGGTERGGDCSPEGINSGIGLNLPGTMPTGTEATKVTVCGRSSLLYYGDYLYQKTFTIYLLHGTATIPPGGW